MPVGLLSLFLVVTILVSNVFRHVLALLLRATSNGLKKDFARQPTVSILLPSYNEGHTVYDTVESISRSNYPLDKLEIIARDDCSVDDTYEWLLKAQKAFSQLSIAVQRNNENSGKAHTVFAALERSRAEIILSIDSDCIFDPNAIRELVACFADPQIGGVGGVVGVRNVNENVLTMGQTFVYYTCFHFLKALESWSRTVTCISGCMFAIRRELMVKLAPEVLSRNWFGIPVNDGEDRFLTHKILLAGYGTVINTDAQCWTTVPNNLKVLFKQQIRWQRSGIRDFFLTLRTLPQHVCSIHPNALYSQLVPTLAALASVFAVLVLQAGQFPYAIAPAVLIFYALLSLVFHIFTRKFNPEQKVRNPFALLALSAWIVAGRLIEILALFTLDSRDWGTRTKRNMPTAPKAETKKKPQSSPVLVSLPRPAYLVTSARHVLSFVQGRFVPAAELIKLLNGSSPHARFKQVHPPVV
ncbi:MAG TPA: glycosyltransferase [Terracidiphilus sp.]|jgi:hyaluronan synthase|nr:glycosyltransferase [Terracidiphilus sp.]